MGTDRFQVKIRCLAALNIYRPFESMAPESLVPAQQSPLLQAQAWRIFITTKLRPRLRPQNLTRGHRSTQCSDSDAFVGQECSHVSWLPRIGDSSYSSGRPKRGLQMFSEFDQKISADFNGSQCPARARI